MNASPACNRVLARLRVLERRQDQRWHRLWVECMLVWAGESPHAAVQLLQAGTKMYLSYKPRYQMNLLKLPK